MVYALRFTNTNEDNWDQFQVDQGDPVVLQLRYWFVSKYQHALCQFIENEAISFLQEDPAALKYLTEIVLQSSKSED